MIASCPSLQNVSGSAIHFDAMLDCFGRQLAAGPFVFAPGGILGSGGFTILLAIAVALLGYRIILTGIPSGQETIGLAARFGIVLALLGSWPLYNTLFVQVAFQGPSDLADVALSRLPTSSGLERMQAAYDTVRLGNVPTEGQSLNPLTQRFQFQAPAPRTAAVFLATAVGAPGMLKVLIGFVLAIGPFAVATLVLGLRTGLFTGWCRALLATAVALAGFKVLASLQLLAVENELARLQAFRTTAAIQGDPQALLFVTLSFGLGIFAVIILSVVVAAALKLPAFRERVERTETPAREGAWQSPIIFSQGNAVGVTSSESRFASQVNHSAHGSRTNNDLSRISHQQRTTEQATTTGMGRSSRSHGDARRGIGRKTRMHQSRDSRR